MKDLMLQIFGEYVPDASGFDVVYILGFVAFAIVLYGALCIVGRSL